MGYLYTGIGSPKSDVFPYVTSGDGFYRDGSFIQHSSTPYIGTYGNVLLHGLADLFYLLSGSSWEVTDPNRKVIFDAVSLSLAPFIYYGAMMDGVRGRAISRSGERDHDDGHGAISNVLRLANGAPSPYAAEFKGLVKGWIQRDTYMDYLSNTGIPQITLARAVLDDSSIAPTPAPVYHKQFYNMDRVIHRRGDWSLEISMCSERVAFYECGNDENLHGWYTNEGMTYLYNSDLGQFTDDFWPTVNPYRLPGTTVDTRHREDCSGGGWGSIRPNTRWVGGASLRDSFGAVGMDLAAYQCTLTARKSWFLVDDTVIALGAGITSSDNRTIETVVENRNLHTDGENALTVDGTEKPGSQGWSETMEDVTWAHLEGVGGYLFPKGATVKALREERTGSWHDINGGGSSDPITRRYVTLWLDHGKNPKGDTYSYALLPNKTANETRSYSQNPRFETLANTADVQAIHIASRRLTAANFWKAGSVGDIRVSGPCSVVMEEHAGHLSVGVSDPSRTQTDITVEIDQKGYKSATSDSTIIIEQVKPTIKFVAHVGGTHGATQTATFIHDLDDRVEPVTLTSLRPIEDTYVRGGRYANDNYGDVTTLVVKSAYGTDYDRQSFFKFDLSGLSGDVESVYLKIYAETADSHGTTTDCQAWSVPDSGWRESEMTWNTKPELGESLGTQSVSKPYGWPST